MKIVTCFKIVPSDEGIKSKPDRTLEISQSDVEISSFDLNAIEAAVNFAAGIDGASVVALTAGKGVGENTKMRKAALSRGPAEMYAVDDEKIKNADAYATAAALAAAIKKIDGCELAIFGEGSADMYNQQVGSIAGFMLGYNTVNAVSKITPIDGGVLVERSVESGVEVLEVKYPAALNVTSDINIPRIPSMKDILGAGKKPFTLWSVDDISAVPESKSDVLSVLAPEATDRKKEIYDGSDAVAVEGFLTAIEKIL